jgi:hypothetical protein
MKIPCFRISTGRFLGRFPPFGATITTRPCHGSGHGARGHNLSRYGFGI